ncbi:MAG: AzlC family ABC transporter permease [Oscillospiraceae bacterium]
MNRRKNFLNGVRDGIPIGLGYLAVSFAVGIAAKNAGISTLMASLMSLLNLTSAGQAAAITLIGAGTTVAEMALTQFIINIRYMLMSCSLSQKYPPDMPMRHRLISSFGITDEIFGICSAQNGYLSPYYCYGAMAMAIPGWTAGTALGSVFGSILPVYAVSALSVALYGMFIAIIVPPSRKSKVIGGIVVLTMAVSGLFAVVPVISRLSAGFRIIIITVCISAGAALLFPVKEEADGQ